MVTDFCYTQLRSSRSRAETLVLKMKGVILRSTSTYTAENEPPIRTFGRRDAAHTHAQRVCSVSGNGFCVQARPDRCSGRLERAVELS